MTIHNQRPASNHPIAPTPGAEPPMQVTTESEVALLRQHMATLQQEVAEQRAQIAALIQQLNQPMATPVENIEAHDTATTASIDTLADTPTNTTPGNPLPTARTTTSRRGLLKWGGLGAAALAAAGTAALSTPPAVHADDGGNMVLGAGNSAASETILLNSSSTSTQGFVVNRYAHTLPQNLQDTMAATVGIGGDGAYAEVGILGATLGYQGSGVMGIATGETSRDFYANGNGIILQKPYGTIGPPSDFLHVVGELIRDNNGDMYLCMNTGNNDLNFPPLWKKLASLTMGYGGGAVDFLTTPIRLYDTRKTGGPFKGNSARNIQVSAVRPPFYDTTEVPLGAVGCVGNLTVTNATAGGYLVIYPQGSSTPTTSTVNFVKGQIAANSFVVGLGSSGQVSIHSFTSGQCDVILDITGFVN